jgi:hypothetical protein
MCLNVECVQLEPRWIHLFGLISVVTLPSLASVALAWGWHLVPCVQVLFPSTPFGGRAGTKSGFGHEFGEAGMHEYINTKTVVGAQDGYSWGYYSSS